MSEMEERVARAIGSGGIMPVRVIDGDPIITLADEEFRHIIIKVMVTFEGLGGIPPLPQLKWRAQR